MATPSDSLLDEMEPRMLRPILPLISDCGIQMKAQVSEPSLFINSKSNEEGGRSLQDTFHGPRSRVRQSSPICSPLGPFTPLKQPQKHCSESTDSAASCSCKVQPGPMSPSDPEIRRLIQEQNQQLQLLRQQVEQLIGYQERLQTETEKRHEATQTSFASTAGDQRSPPRQERTEFTLTFRDLQLETIVEQPPSPQPSILVQMQDYPESLSERSSAAGLVEDSVSGSCTSVMEQVQRLLAQVDANEKPRQALHDRSNDVSQHNPAKKVTMQRLQELGISFVGPTTSIYGQRPGVGPQAKSPWIGPMAWNGMETRKETDQSVEMKMLAEKYLGKRNNFLSKIEQPQANRKPVEMSMSTRQYLERYGLTD